MIERSDQTSGCFADPHGRVAARVHIETLSIALTPAPFLFCRRLRLGSARPRRRPGGAQVVRPRDASPRDPSPSPSPPSGRGSAPTPSAGLPGICRLISWSLAMVYREHNSCRPVSARRYRQSELQHARWAMLGVAGILGQEILNPGQFWCDVCVRPFFIRPSVLFALAGMQQRLLMGHWGIRLLVRSLVTCCCNRSAFCANGTALPRFAQYSNEH